LYLPINTNLLVDSVLKLGPQGQVRDNWLCHIKIKHCSGLKTEG
jgi:hypothetical protein